MEIINNSDSYDYYIDILLVGKIKIGKTFFLDLLKSNFNYFEYKEIKKSNYISTFGIDFEVRYIKFKNKIFKLHIYDSSGSERFENIIKYYYKGSFVILLFYDSFDRNSFEKVKRIYNENYSINSIYILVRNKYDLKSEKEFKDFVSDEEALEYADKNNMFFEHISNFEKYEKGINNLIELILIQYLKKLI